MRRGSEGFTRRPGTRQRLLPFLERAERRDRQFKRAIVTLTALAVGALLGGTTVGRYAVRSLARRARLAATRLLGLEPDRPQVEALRRIERARAVDGTRQALARYYRGA